MKALKRIIAYTLIAVMITLQFIGGTELTAHAQTIQQIESIRVSGGVFDTGLVINQDYSIEMVFSLSTLSQYANIYEAPQNKSYVYALRNESSKGIYVRHGWYNQKVYSPDINQEITVNQKKNITYINGRQILKMTYQTMNSTDTLKFGNFKGNIKSFKVWNGNNKLVREYIPAIGANSQVCMRDTVSGEYLKYSGNCSAVMKTITDTEESDKKESVTEQLDTEKSTAETTEETVIKPTASNIDYVEALELKNAKFDTGIMANQDYSIEMTFSLANLSQYVNLYETGNSSKFVYLLRNEAGNGLYARHGWYNQKVYTPKVNEEITVNQKKNVTYINDKKVLSMTRQTLTATNTLKFGGFKGTLVSFKVWDEKNNLIGEYLPAKDTSSKACVYDTVSKKYIYAAGTCTAIEEEKETEKIEIEEAEKEEIEVEEVEREEVKVESVEKEEIEVEEVEREEIKVESAVKDNETLLKETILEMLVTGDTSVRDVSAYKFAWVSMTNMSNFFNEVAYGEGRVAYASCFNMYYTTTRNSEGIVQTFQLKNIDSGYLERYHKLKALVDSLVNESEGMTDTEKVVFAHDYVVSHCSYSTDGNLTYTAAGALVNGKASCAGYARAMIMLLEEMGVESEYVSSETINHAWLKVKINDRWYHADPTWDDTRSSVKGQVSHEFLLKTDEEYLAGGSNKHYGWEGTISTDKTYSNWAVHDIVGQIYHNNGDWYYIKNGQKISIDVNP